MSAFLTVTNRIVYLVHWREKRNGIFDRLGQVNKKFSHWLAVNRHRSLLQLQLWKRGYNGSILDFNDSDPKHIPSNFSLKCSKPQFLSLLCSLLHRPLIITFISFTLIYMYFFGILLSFNHLFNFDCLKLNLPSTKVLNFFFYRVTFSTPVCMIWCQKKIIKKFSMFWITQQLTSNIMQTKVFKNSLAAFSESISADLSLKYLYPMEYISKFHTKA